MRIAKQYDSVQKEGKILNSKSTSQSDTYSCDYTNKNNLKVGYFYRAVQMGVNDAQVVNIGTGGYNNVKAIIFNGFTCTVGNENVNTITPVFNTSPIIEQMYIYNTGNAQQVIMSFVVLYTD